MRDVKNMGLWALSGPLLIELVMSFSINSVDGYFFSQISDSAISAFGALFAIFSLAFFVFDMIANGAGSVASQFIGAGQKEKVTPSYLMGFTIVLPLSAILCVTFLFFSDPIMSLLGVVGETKENAVLYINIIGPFFFIQHIRFCYLSILSSQGETKWNMTNGVLTNVLNAFLNYIFVFGAPGIEPMGIKGIAYATVISQAAGMFFLMYAVHYKLAMQFDFQSYFKNFKEIFMGVVRIALPSSFEPFVFSAMQAVIIYIITGLGDTALATRTIVTNILVFCVIWNFAIGIGTQILTSHRLGARMYKKNYKQMNESLLLGLLGTSIVMLAVIWGLDYILPYWTKNTEIITLIHQIIWVSFAMEVGRIGNIIIGMSLRAAGDAMFPTAVTIILMPLVVLIGSWYFAFHLGWGLLGVWVALAADEIIRALASYIRWSLGIWENKSVAKAGAKEAEELGELELAKA